MKKIIFSVIGLALIFGLVGIVSAAVDQNSWEVNTNPVFDGIGRAYYPSVLKIDGTYHMWYTDEDLGGAYVIGYTISNDGLTWSDSTMTTGLTGAPNHVVVVNVGTEGSPYYKIWYADASVWPYNFNLFRTAESSDGITWINDVVMTSDPTAPLFTNVYGTWWYGSYGPGAVLYNSNGYETINDVDPMSNKYVMYYDVYSWHQGTQENTALAYSVDGIDWKRYGTMPIIMAEGDNDPSAWDAGYLYAWSVLKLEDGYHMWYSGGILDSNDGVGYAYSIDGITWTKGTENPVLHADDAGAQIWRQDRTYTPMVLLDCDDSEWKMYFSARDGRTINGYNKYLIGLATMPADNIVCPLPRSAEITSPTEGQVVSGLVSFDAVLTDDDTDDNVQWAVRKGTCAAGTNTVFGNVDGFSDSFTWINNVFHAEADTSTWIPGEYCFIFNPTEGAGEDNIRLTRNFVLTDTIAPIVTIESPNDGDSVNGIVDIYGTIVEDLELSHYNISIYPGDADFNDFSKRLEQETKYLSSGFNNQLIYQWDTTTYNDGDYLIRLAARDKTGNRDLSGDPYAGGDDSQHVIKIIVKNSPGHNGPSIDKDQCKKGGWKEFENPSFKNQGDCISYFQSNENAKGNRKDNQ